MPFPFVSICDAVQEGAWCPNSICSSLRPVRRWEKCWGRAERLSVEQSSHNKTFAVQKLPWVRVAANPSKCLPGAPPCPCRPSTYAESHWPRMVPLRALVWGPPRRSQPCPGPPGTEAERGARSLTHPPSRLCGPGRAPDPPEEHPHPQPCSGLSWQPEETPDSEMDGLVCCRLNRVPWKAHCSPDARPPWGLGLVWSSRLGSS